MGDSSSKFQGGRRAALLAAAAATYWFLVRRWHLRWGATGDEATRYLPGDAIIPELATEATHAVTVDAPPTDVWPWLVQMGQDRGGFYSYEALENLVGADIHNVDRVVPEWQEREVGDTVRLAPPDYPVDNPDSRPTVAVVEPERALVLRSPVDPPNYTWAFVLEATDGATRLVVRFRTREQESLGATLAEYLFWEPAHFVMERKMLLGIKERVESSDGGTGDAGVS